MRSASGSALCCTCNVTRRAGPLQVNKVSCWLATNLMHLEAPAQSSGDPSAGLEAAQGRARSLSGAGVLDAMQAALRRPGQVGKAELGPRLRTAIARMQSLLGEPPVDPFR